MLRVPIPLWGVAVGLFTASTVAGQTPEPPAAFPFEPPSSVSPDLFRQVSAELNNPLLTMMVEGELAAIDSAALQDSSRLKPTPNAKSSTPAASNPCPDGAVTDESSPCEIECPSVPCFLPYAYPQQQSCGHKCHRRQKGSCFGGHGQSCGNQYGYGYGGYPGCYGGQPNANQGCGCRHCQRKHGCGQQGCGWGGGYGGYPGAFGPMNYDGYMDGCFGCGYAPYGPPQQQGCHGHKCRHGGCGNNYGYGGYGNQGWGAYGGFGGCGSCFPPPPPPQQSGCRFCHKHKSQNCSWANYGYPGWPAYPVPGANQWDDGYNSFTDPNCYGSGGCKGKHCCACCHKQHHCFGHFRHGHCGHYQPSQYPYAAYPMTAPCFAMDDFCSDCSLACDGPPAASSPAPSGAKKK